MGRVRSANVRGRSSCHGWTRLHCIIEGLQQGHRCYGVSGLAAVVSVVSDVVTAIVVVVAVLLTAQVEEIVPRSWGMLIL